MRGPTQSALRVLIVDDNADTAASLALLFRTWGHDVAVAEDGHSAIRTALEFRPEAVILDIGLPMMDGFEVAKRLRSMPGLGRPFLVASSGFNREGDFRRAEAVGIDHYLVKPFDPFGLESILASCRSSELEATPA